MLEDLHDYDVDYEDDCEQDFDDGYLDVYNNAISDCVDKAVLGNYYMYKLENIRSTVEFLISYNNLSSPPGEDKITVGTTMDIGNVCSFFNT